ncbi:MAG: segregation/condensation protein A, partial [Chloroflexota bacterium]
MPFGRTAFVSLPAAPIQLPRFEGPLELLLRLLDEGEMEITSISLAAVTDQYLGFLRLLPDESLKLDFLAEFLVVASHLLVLKSRVLLPREAPPPLDDEALDEAALEQRLAEYRRFRDAA